MNPLVCNYFISTGLIRRSKMNTMGSSSATEVDTFDSLHSLLSNEVNMICICMAKDTAHIKKCVGLLYICHRKMGKLYENLRKFCIVSTDGCLVVSKNNFSLLLLFDV